MTDLKQSPVKLPATPSQLLYVAIADLKKALADPLIIIDMADWHLPTVSRYEQRAQNKPRARCSVCFAGAVIAQHPDVTISDNLGPHDFDRITHHRLYALNEIRTNNFTGFMNYLGYGPDFIAITRNMLGGSAPRVQPWRESDPEPFFTSMTALADKLADIGL